ncbi:MAG TPA: RNA polymerase sigma factor [Bryobacteraceae bacterium]|jgi:RNA polymerase sigma-70 factor (ECF subfamily)|nr:RNA polymerase sigma factor [Bryobacteraceae bacterium]
MFRETTINDIGCDHALDNAAAGFVMDEDTFRAFYERTARGLWAYLTRVTGDRTLAEDLLQEAFYRFLRASATYASEAHRRNSLYRIATNLARDARRRSLARAAATLVGDDIERVPSGLDAAAAEHRTDFTRAMTRLKPRERAILWLAYAEGASHSEIAEVVGVRATSLKPMLFRARRRLATLLGRAPKGEKS